MLQPPRSLISPMLCCLLVKPHWEEALGRRHQETGLGELQMGCSQASALIRVKVKQE